MKCFNHETTDAVAICKNCNKAICHACAVDVGNGIACRNSCEDEVRAVNALIQRNKSTSQKTSYAYQRNAIICALLGAIFAYLSVDAYQSKHSPLLVVTSEMNAGLTQVLEGIVTEAKGLVPAGQRLTVLFDRGGWSPRLFARLNALGVDIITYRKGKRRPLPRSHFSEHKVKEDGKEKTY